MVFIKFVQPLESSAKYPFLFKNDNLLQNLFTKSFATDFIGSTMPSDQLITECALKQSEFTILSNQKEKNYIKYRLFQNDINQDDYNFPDSNANFIEELLHT